VRDGFSGSFSIEKAEIVKEEIKKSMSAESRDRIWMKRALQLARKGAGYVSPNPMVGCVIVSDSGDIIGEGYHERYGKDHAEVNAIRTVGDPKNLTGATVYVTLEPCSHHGKTPPCADLLAGFPLKRVVVAMKDPNPDVNGAGIRRLMETGIQVETGLMEKEAIELNQFFLHHMEFGRPYVILKIAQTADGFVAAPDGESRWITGVEARKQVHEWRARYDAVLVGRNTAELDNPSLTVRHVEGRQPIRVVIDGPFTLSRELNLFSDSFEEKTIVLTWNSKKSNGELDPMLQLIQGSDFRGKVLKVGQYEGHTDLREAMHALGKEGISSLMVESGSSLAAAFLRAGLVDQLELFIAPKLLGGGQRSMTDLGINKMDEILTFRSVSWKRVGDDMLLTAKF